MTFAMVVRDLVNSPNPDVSMLSLEMIKELENEGYLLFKKDFVLESIKLFIITKNVSRLVEIGKYCLINSRLELAYLALSHTNERVLLTELGLRFIVEKQYNYARGCFEVASNKEMIAFLEKNY